MSSLHICDCDVIHEDLVNDTRSKMKPENDYDKLATIIDYESWADWFIMNEFSRNADAYRISCVFTVNSASDKIVANPIWDYELGWGNQDTKTTGLMVEDTQYYSDDFPTPFWWTGTQSSFNNCGTNDGESTISSEKIQNYLLKDEFLNHQNLL